MTVLSVDDALHSVARVVVTERPIAPFGEDASQVPLLDRSLHDFRSREVGGLKGAERLTLASHALATRPLLARFLAQANGAPARLALQDTDPHRRLVVGSSVERRPGLLLYDVFANAKNEALEVLRETTEPLVVTPKNEVLHRPLPRLGSPPFDMELPFGPEVVGHFEHWLHFLWLAPLLVPALRAHRPGRKKRAGRGLTPNFIAKSAKIHHTALVEGSVLGDNVHIGAHAVVRHSYVGSDSWISDLTRIEHSVLGAGTHTLADGSFRFTVSLGESTLANFGVRDTILGQRVFLTSAVIFWTDVLDGTAEVDGPLGPFDSERRVLGSCVGHGSVLGARTILAPGRALPNRSVIVMRKEEAVAKFENAPHEPACWADGALVPVENIDPDYVPEELGAS